VLTAGQYEQIAAAIVYLASEAPTYVTCAILSIDGGSTAW
jgi:NAD(P)-dependent dehydrogenase (short-subunit alcohol dehydrogenase family)